MPVEIGPCKGVTLWRTPAGLPVLRIHYTARPDMVGEVLEAERKRYSSEAYWRQEMEIEDEALEGQRVYPEFDPVVHVLPDELVPRRGCRYMAIDPHPRTPHAFLWVLVDRWGDFYVYRELWPSAAYGQPQNLRDSDQEGSFTIREYAESVARLEGNRLEWFKAETPDEYGLYRRGSNGENIVCRYMDPSGKGFLASDESFDTESYNKRYRRYGVHTVNPKRSHRSGEDAIRDLLKLRFHDTRGMWPRLHVAASCIELQFEFRKFRYPVIRRWTDTRELKQEGIEARHHLIDCLRYLATGQTRYIPTLES